MLRSRPASLALVLMIFPALASAATLHVPGDYPTIQQAFSASSDGDVILVAAGTYYESLIVAPAGRTLTSESGAAATIIDGGLKRIITVSGSGTFEVSGFTFQHGGGGQSGTVLYMFGSVSANITANIHDNVFANNDGDFGPIFARDCSITVTHNRFDHNQAQEGAGIYLRHCDGEIAYNEFLNGTAHRHSGAIYIYSASPHVHHNLIVNCTAGENGGGIAIARDSAPLLDHNTLVGCSSTLGGGIHVGNESGVAQIVNNIVVGGTAGYGIDDGVYSGSAPPYLSCNDLWNNLPGDYYLITPGPGNISADPEFCDPATGDYAISGVSPCAPSQAPDCGLIGALDPACGLSTSVANPSITPSSWGSVKAVFR